MVRWLAAWLVDNDEFNVLVKKPSAALFLSYTASFLHRVLQQVLMSVDFIAGKVENMGVDFVVCVVSCVYVLAGRWPVIYFLIRDHPESISSNTFRADPHLRPYCVCNFVQDVFVSF